MSRTVRATGIFAPVGCASTATRRSVRAGALSDARIGTRCAAFALLGCLAVGCGRSTRDDGRRNPPPGQAGTGGSGGSIGEAGAGAGGGTGGTAASGGSASGGTAGTSAGAAGAPDDPTLGSVVLDGTPFYTRFQRLTASQWEHAVADVLRFAEPQHLAQNFLRPVRGVTDFDNNEKVLFVDAQNVVDFETGAEAAAALATGSDAALAALYPGDDVAGFVPTLGRRAFRRPLTEAEVGTYTRIFARGEELYGNGFAHGAALVIRAMLASPHFLYRTELGPAGESLTGYELASKLSFWLLDTTPSDELLDAAAAGTLDSDEGLEAIARSLLEAPAAVAALREFHRQLFHVEDYASLVKDGVPEFGPAVPPELESASTAFFDRIFQAGLGLREILTAKQAYVGPALAPFYGVDAAASGLELVELGSARSGYFMQVPFLTWGAIGERSDPAQRGERMQHLLCAPASISSEPLGLSLESFDGLGRERLDEKSPKTAGSYPFAEGVREFVDGSELVRIMADSLQAHTCYSKYVTGYALGRDLGPEDRPLLEGLGRVSSSQSLKELALALVRERTFRARPEASP